MNSLYRDAKIIERLSEAQDGVFSNADLKSIIDFSNSASLYRRIKNLTDNNILRKFAAGFYVTEKFKPAVLSQRLCPRSYLSFGTVLAEELVISSIPAKRVWAVKIGPTREYTNQHFAVQQFGIQSKYFFGFTNLNGVNRATKEKAFIDTLYFYQSGVRFSFNIYSDINTDILDNELIYSYLIFYQNPKFISFVKGIIHGG